MSPSLLEVTSLTEPVNILEGDTLRIKASMGGGGVVVGGEIHHSPDNLVGWTIQNVSKINVCPTKMIIDIVSLLKHLQDTGKILGCKDHFQGYRQERRIQESLDSSDLNELLCDNSDHIQWVGYG
jgi:hypothetical protein